MGKYIFCTICGRQFNTVFALERHECGIERTRKDDKQVKDVIIQDNEVVDIKERFVNE